MTIFASAVLGPDGRPYDQIRLTGVTATGHHGVLPHEREEGQKFSADVVLHLDTRPAATGDALADTVSYADVAQDVHAVLAGSPADLIETVAERIAAAVLEHPAVQAVDVRVHKPHAPIAVPFDDVEVAVRRDRVKTPVAAPVRPAEAPAPAPAAEAATVVPTPVSAPLPVPFPPVPPAAAPMPIPAPVPVPAHAEAVPPPPEPEPAPEPPVDRLDVDPVEPVEVVLAIGGNLGDPQATLREAITDIDRLPGIQVTEVSPLARTTAVGGPEEQPDYLNAVLIARTTLSPRALLRATQAVENAHGRVREERWGPRTLDVDIVRYGSLVASAEDLELPHPRAAERAFVLVPWAEVQPDAELPGLGGGPVARLAETAPDRAGIRWMALDWLTEASVRTGSYPVATAQDAEPDGDDEQAGPGVAAAPDAAPAEPPAPDAGAPWAPQQHFDTAPAYQPEPAPDPARGPEHPPTPDAASGPQQAYHPLPVRGEEQRPGEPYGHAGAAPFHPATPPEHVTGSHPHEPVPVTPFPRVVPADPVDPPAPTVQAARPATPVPPITQVPPTVVPSSEPRGVVNTPVSPFAPVHPAGPYQAAVPGVHDVPVAQVFPAQAPQQAPQQAMPWQPAAPGQTGGEPSAHAERWIPYDHPDQGR